MDNSVIKSAENELHQTLGYGYKIDFRIGKPIEAPIPNILDEKLYANAVHCFFEGVYGVLDASLHNEVDPDINEYLFGINRQTYGVEYHKLLDKNYLNAPIFFEQTNLVMGKLQKYNVQALCGANIYCYWQLATIMK